MRPGLTLPRRGRGSRLTSSETRQALCQGGDWDKHPEIEAAVTNTALCLWERGRCLPGGRGGCTIGLGSVPLPWVPHLQVTRVPGPAPCG